MHTTTVSTEPRREGFFWDYLEKLSRCEFNVKIFTMLFLAGALTVTFMDVTPTPVRVLAALISLGISLMMGAVKI